MGIVFHEVGLEDDSFAANVGSVFLDQTQDRVIDVHGIGGSSDYGYFGNRIAGAQA